MKTNITLIKTTKKNRVSVKQQRMDDLIKSVSIGYEDPVITQLREFCYSASKYVEFSRMYRLAQVCPSAEMKTDGEGNLVMRQFNGLLTLTVALNSDEEAGDVKRMVAALPMTMAAVTGSSGMTVKVITALTRADGKLPQDENEAEKLLQQSCPLICQLYEVALRRVRSKGHLTVSPALRRGDPMLLHAAFRMTHDPQAFYRPQPTPILIPEGLSEQFPQVAPTSEGAGEGNPSVGQETRQLINLLESRYEFRQNKVMGYVEYCAKENRYYGWLPVDERVQNSMALEARLAGLDVWDKDVNRYIKSNMIRLYDPIGDYLWDLHGTWDGHDHIGALAATVPTNNPLWPRWFRIWFLGMVSQWLGRNPRYGNSIAPLLISKQGYNKSTFCKSLIPPELQWGYNDNLVLSEKKSVLQAMSQFLLINLDEFNQISPKVQEGFLKNLIQLASVKVKRPYGKHVEDFPRLASFIATANLTDILADPSGNRRFIGIELTGPIDVTRRINYNQLYAQAMALLDQGELCWLDEHETRLVMESNRQFQLRSPEEIFFNECFAIAESEAEGQYMTSAAIFNVVRKAAGSAIRGGNVRAFGRFLTNMDGLQRIRTRRGTEYLVKFI